MKTNDDVITATMGMSVMGVLASIQPIEDERGLVYFENVISGTTKGSQTKGDVVVNPLTGSVTPDGYASNFIDLEEGVAATVAADFDYTFTLAQYPIKSETLQLTFTGDTSIVAEDVGPKTANKDLGALYGNKLSGTVNYITGEVNIKFTDDPLAGNKVLAAYQYNYELAADIPKIQTFMDSKQIHARVYALKATLGLLQQYTMTKKFGSAGADMISKKLVTELNKEMGGDLIRKVKAGAVGLTTFSRTVLAGTAKYEHKLGYLDSLNDADAVMVGNAGRGEIKVMVVGRNHAAFVKGLPGFVSLGNPDNIGPQVFGKVGNVTYVRVTETSIMGLDEGFGMYKGATPFEAAAVYSPFMPVTLTGVMGEGVNPLNSQQAIAAIAGVDNLVPQYSTKLNIVA